MSIKASTPLFDRLAGSAGCAALLVVIPDLLIVLHRTSDELLELAAVQPHATTARADVDLDVIT